MISDLVDAYWRRVLAATAVPAASLGVFRWIFGIFQLLVDVPHFRWIDDVPHGLFDPSEFSLAYLVGGFPRDPFFTVVDIVGIVALVAMTIGWRTRAATLTVVATRLVGTTFAYSFGKIDHTDTMLTFLLAALAFSSWGDFYTLPGVLGRTGPTAISGGDDAGPPAARIPSKPLAVFASVLVFGMFTAGLTKLRGWVDFDLTTSGVLRWYYPNRDMLGRDRLLAGVVPGTRAILLELGDYVAVLMELSGLAFLLAGRRAWLAYLSILTAFHLANVLVLNIAFPAQVITYLVFAGLTIPPGLDARKLMIGASAVAGLAAAWDIGRRLVGGGAITVLTGSQSAQAVYLLYISMFVCVGVLLALLNAVKRARSEKSTPAQLVTTG